MPEEYAMPGRIFDVDDPTSDGLRIVQATYPDATREGSVGHWSYSQDGWVVGEAWMKRRGGWRLRVLDPNQRPTLKGW